MTKTYIFSNTNRRILVECSISKPMSMQRFQMKALVDTGAMRTCLSKEVAQLLGLAVDNVVEVTGAENKTFAADLYTIDCQIEGYAIPLIQAVGLPMSGRDINMILGMDILSHCDFALTHPNGQTKVSIQIPSQADIEFT